MCGETDKESMEDRRGAGHTKSVCGETDKESMEDRRGAGHRECVWRD